MSGRKLDGMGRAIKVAKGLAIFATTFSPVENILSYRTVKRRELKANICFMEAFKGEEYTPKKRDKILKRLDQ